MSANRKAFSKQETFDLVATHLLKQGRKSLVSTADDDTCAYRGNGGLKCAVGAVIPDDDYYPGIEGLCASQAEVAALLSQLGHDVDLLIDLQHVHDESRVENWKQELNAIADERGLRPVQP